MERDHNFHIAHSPETALAITDWADMLLLFGRNVIVVVVHNIEGSDKHKVYKMQCHDAKCLMMLRVCEFTEKCKIILNVIQNLVT